MMKSKDFGFCALIGESLSLNQILQRCYTETFPVVIYLREM